MDDAVPHCEACARPLTADGADRWVCDNFDCERRGTPIAIPT